MSDEIRVTQSIVELAHSQDAIELQASQSIVELAHSQDAIELQAFQFALEVGINARSGRRRVLVV